MYPLKNYFNAKIPSKLTGIYAEARHSKAYLILSIGYFTTIFGNLQQFLKSLTIFTQKVYTLPIVIHSDFAIIYIKEGGESIGTKEEEKKEGCGRKKG